MTKRQLIDEIVTINHTASPRFLAKFGDAELCEYLAHLRVLSTPRLSGNAERYEKYFRDCPTIPATRPQWRTDPDRVEEVVADDLADVDQADEETYALRDADDLAEGAVSPAEREQLFADPVEEDQTEPPSEPEGVEEEFGEALPLAPADEDFDRAADAFRDVAATRRDEYAPDPTGSLGFADSPQDADTHPAEHAEPPSEADLAAETDAEVLAAAETDTQPEAEAQAPPEVDAITEVRTKADQEAPAEPRPAPAGQPPRPRRQSRSAIAAAATAADRPTPLFERNDDQTESWLY